MIDARMGRGKTTAAIRYMNEHKKDSRFLFITPYLTEVERICEMCDFEQPDSDYLTKSAELKRKMNEGKNIAATHSLFYLMDNEALGIAKRNGYSLIIDETVNTISRIPITASDLNIILEQFAYEDEDGWLSWRDPDYVGMLYKYKEMADANALLHLDTSLMNIMNPIIFKSFEKVFVLTYMFRGQYQRAYFDFFGIPYNIVGVTRDDKGFMFSDAPDNPPPVDFKSLINIIDNPTMNKIGNRKGSLSLAWYGRHSSNSDEIKNLRGHLFNFFQRITHGGVNKRIWTCFKSEAFKVTGYQGRYRKNFLPMNVRAMNEYRESTDVAYLVNRYCDPNITKFFAQRNISIGENEFALSEMLQFVWRSAIRDNNPINLYIPSKRMREMLIEWIDDVGK